VFAARMFRPEVALMTDGEHERRIVEQFTRQAVPFAEVPAHSNEAALRLMLRQSGAGPADEVLDAGCGPGIVACAFAPHVHHVTGTDITPAMLERARSAAQQAGLANVAFLPGDMYRQPFPDGRFSLVTTRYTFHHLVDPAAALRELVRVCRPGGRVMVVDAAVEPQFAAAYDEAELIRDPSHVHALPPAEFPRLLAAAGLAGIETSLYRLEIALDQQLAASFPDPGGAERLRRLFEEDVAAGRMGLGVHRREGGLHYSVPCAVATGRKG